jgi:hypothetical protein
LREISNEVHVNAAEEGRTIRTRWKAHDLDTRAKRAALSQAAVCQSVDEEDKAEVETELEEEGDGLLALFEEGFEGEFGRFGLVLGVIDC